MTFWYLATPYTDYPLGRVAAFRMAAMVTAKLIQSGVPVFSPITHSHPVATWGYLDPVDHDLWMQADAPFVEAACGLIVWQALGWMESHEIAHSVAAFQKLGKPIVYVPPGQYPRLPAWILAGGGA